MSWTDDGSDNKLALSGSEAKYSPVAGGSSSKANAIWSEGGTGLWQFSVSGESGTWIGVSTADRFGPGYRMKGLFFGGPGNLSDGNSLVTGQWGPEFGDGDVIGLKIEQTGDHLTVAYSKNGASLGVAFDISGWTYGEVRPAISMDTSGQAVTISRGTGSETMDTTRPTTGNEGIEGNWKGEFSVQIRSAGDKSWRVSAKVANSMNCTVTQQNGQMVAGPVMSTRMMPPPHLQSLEQEVSAMLAGLTAIRRDGANLVFEGDGKTKTLEADSGPGPAKKENINWMN